MTREWPPAEVCRQIHCRTNTARSADTPVRIPVSSYPSQYGRVSSQMTERYVDLKRRFARFDSKSIGEDIVVRSYTDSPLLSHSTLTWEDIFKARLTVVLGEPGSGKTAEFCNRASSIQKNGDFAFFVPLERLVGESLRSVLSEANEERFDSWLQSKQTAVFLLDSVDESRIRQQRDFEHALHRFAKDITVSGLQRTRVVLSSRVSEWRGAADSALVRTILRAPVVTERRRIVEPLSFQEGALQDRDVITDDDDHAQEKLHDELQVVRLLPLDKEMVTRLLEEMRFDRVPEIIAEFDRCYLWSFTRRPIDALRYAGSVCDGQDLGNLTSILRHDIEERLRETREREQNNVLTQADAEIGVTALATATVFARRSVFLVSGDDKDGEKVAIDAAKCLPSKWTMPQVKALLNRAVFDVASRGTIRFHHRSVTEFLAARWLSERAQQGCPIANIEHLLCARPPDGRIIREGFQPVVAWLACGTTALASEARAWILEAAPELFFSYGDPDTLDIDYRAKLLEAFVMRYAGRKHTWTDADPENLSRFGDATLAPVLNRIARDSSRCEDVRLTSLRIARHARVADCVDTAVVIAADTEQPEYIRIAATSVVRDVGSNDQVESLAAKVKTLVRIPSRMVGVLVECLYPSVASAAELVDLMRLVDASSEEMVTDDYWLREYFKSELDATHAIDLLAALLPLVCQEPTITLDGKPTRISSEFDWLGHWFSELLDKAISATSLRGEQCDQLAGAWAWLEEFADCSVDRVSLPEDLDAKSTARPELRRAYFWRKAASFRGEQRLEPQYAHEFLGIYGRGGFVPAKPDVTWLVDDICSRPDTRDRELALQVVFNVYLTANRPRSVLRQIREAVAGQKALERALNGRLSRLRFATFKQLWARFVRRRLLDKYWWMRWRREWSAWYRSKRESFWLFRNVRLLADGSRPRVLAILAHEAQKEDSSTRLAPTTWDKLRNHRGHRVTNAVAAGCRIIWQNYEPELPHEKKSMKSIDNRLIAGLAGLSTGIYEGAIDLTKLTERDVQRAVRYALGEMDGFPPWFPLLAEHHPDIVRRVLCKAIVGEWNWTDKDTLHGVLHDLHWSERRVRNLVETDIVDLLDKSPPDHPAILRIALQCLTDAPAELLSRVQGICMKKLREDGLDSPRFVHWIVTLIQLDADQAFRQLERLSADKEEHVELAVAIIAELSGEDRTANSRQYGNAPDASPQYLSRLLQFCHRLIRPKDDINRPGRGAYSPTPRDFAQRFRDSLLSKIADSESPDTLDALTALLKMPELESYTDYILGLLAKRRRSDCSLPPWNEQDVAQFATEFEADPKSSEELFVIIQRRLLDLHREITASDNSLREELRAGDDEPMLRRWLTRKLDACSRGRYRVPQEVEIDQAQRPDIRAECPGIAPIPIEVKWAERWSCNELAERLENQLVGQYLRAHENQHGIYLLGYIDEERKATWRGDGHSVTFEELLVELQKTADDLVARDASIIGVRVVGLDFREPAS